MDLQKIVNSMNDMAQRTRSDYHLTLGKIIKALEACDPDNVVRCDNGQHPGHLTSYRGYYCDLAFTPSNIAVTCSKIHEMCKAALGSEFEGYKGGDYLMTEKTPLWLSAYGDNSGIALVSTVVSDGEIILVTKQIHDDF